jgi:hypothetical protein
MRAAAGDFGDFLAVGLAEHAVETCEAAGDGGEGGLIPSTHGDAEQELVEGDGGLALHRAGVGLVGLGDADGIDEDEAGFSSGIRRDAGEGVGIDGAGPPPFHLLEVELGADVAQEEQALERLDVGAGGDHVHGDGDAELRGGAEGLDDVLGFPAGAVGDLFAEVVSFAELFADDIDDVLGVAVVLGEDEGLGHPGFVEAHGFGTGGAVGEDLGEEFFPEGPDDGAELIGDDNGAVELGFLIGFLGFLDFPALGAGEAVALLIVVPRLDCDAFFGDFGFDPVDVVADVHAIGDGLDVRVFGDEVPVEESERGLAGSGGESDEEGVEVFDDLLPQVVDGAVAFVDDDEVEGLDGDLGIVAHFQRR